jgi:uncharacterized membrane protein
MMKLIKFTKLNNIPYWLYQLSLLLVINLLVVFHIPYISDIAGFGYLFFIPGYFITHTIRLTYHEFWPKMLQIVGLGTAFDMIVGLLANTFLPFIGITQPLGFYPILIIFDILLLIIIDIGIYKNKAIINLRKSIPKINLSLNLIFLGCLPVLAIMGATTLNNGGSNWIVMILITTIITYVFSLFVNRNINSDDKFMGSLYFIALALLFMTSMRGWHITGYDVHQEFHVFQLTKDPLFWSMSHLKDPYNACLSITILPTIISQYIRIPDEYIYKFLSQLFFAFMPVVIYLLVRNFSDNKKAFLAGFIYISQAWYFQGMPTLIRQEFGILFFGLVLLTIFDITLQKNLKYCLAMLYGMSMILSHYSTSYITIIIFIIVFCLNVVLHLLHKYVPVTVKNQNLTRNITLMYIIFLVSTVLTWNVVITQTSNNLSKFIDKSSSSINSTFSRDNILYAINQILYPYPRKFDFNNFTMQVSDQFRQKWSGLNFYNDQQIKSQNLQLVNFQQIEPNFGDRIYKFSSILFRFVKILVNDIFVQIGLIFLVYEWYKGKFKSNELILLIFAGFIIFILLLIIPGALKDYNIERLYIQLLTVWSFAGICGALTLARIFKFVDKYIFITIIYFLPLLYYSGYIFNFTGGPALLSMNNFGEDYEKAYTFDTDKYAVRWLMQNSTKPLINTNSPGINKLWAFGTFDMNRIVENTLPGVISKDSYVYLTYMNTQGNKALVKYINEEYPYTYPSDFLNENKDEIYSNGRSIIYK